MRGKAIVVEVEMVVKLEVITEVEGAHPCKQWRQPNNGWEAKSRCIPRAKLPGAPL